MNLVDCVGDGVQGGVETEGDLRGRKIVVDCLRDADDLHSPLKKFVANLLRSVAADGDDGVNAELSGVGDDLSGNIARNFFAVFDGFVVEGIAAVGGAENGATARKDTTDIFLCELECFLWP